MSPFPGACLFLAICLQTDCNFGGCGLQLFAIDNAMEFLCIVAANGNLPDLILYNHLDVVRMDGVYFIEIHDERPVDSEKYRLWQFFFKGFHGLQRNNSGLVGIENHVVL